MMVKMMECGGEPGLFAFGISGLGTQVPLELLGGIILLIPPVLCLVANSLALLLFRESNRSSLNQPCS